MNRKSFYTIREASEELGISQETLKNWDRSGKLSPRRNGLGWRLYSQDEIEKAKGIILPVDEAINA